MLYITTLLLSLFITISLVPLSVKLAAHLHAFDIPDARKIHTTPIPRTGGLAMALGALIPFAFFAEGTPLVEALIVAAAILVTVGVIDDFKSLGYKPKFAAQIIAALVVIFYGGVKITSLGLMLPDTVVLPDYVAIPLTVLAIVGVTNAINLSDGLDGLAGGICLLIFCCIGYLAYQAERPNMALLSVAMIGAIFGFLRFNTHPATIFMGDTGSQLLGFAAVTLAITITQDHTPLSPALPLVLLGFPVLDTLAVMFERVTHGRSPFVADKNHLHHKLIRRGFSHSESVLVIYIIQSILVTSAFLLRFHSEWLLLFGYLGFSGMVVTAFSIADHAGWKLKRYDLIDTMIKGKLKVLAHKGLLIKALGRTIEVAVPLLFIVSCTAAASIPFYISGLALLFAGFLAFTLLIKKSLIQGALRNMYLLIPFVIYFSEKEMVSWMTPPFLTLYNLSFVGVALLVILTLKFTRRKQGFRFNLMDFLILFIALAVPNLPEPQIQSYHLGLLTTKIIVFLFSFEVLMGELRGKYRRLAYPMLGALLILIVKGFVGK